MSKCILVLGTPRSGTSCVAGILHRLGVFMGDRFLPADDWNPEGYYQDIEFEKIIIDKLSQNHNTSEDIDWFPPWPLDKGDGIHSNKIKELIIKRNKENEIWGVKSNRLVYFLEELQELSDVLIIKTTRNRNLSIASWKKRSGHSQEKSEQIIDRMNDSIIKSLEKVGSVSLEIPYDQLIENPAFWISQIAQLVQKPFDSAVINWVNPQLRRFI